MVHRVADDVDQRIANGLQHRAVQLSFSAHLNQLDFFASFRGGIAHQPGELEPDAANLLHAREHHALLQFQGNKVHGPHRGHQVGIHAVGRTGDQAVAGQHHFADQVHQLVEQIDIDPHLRDHVVALGPFFGRAVVTDHDVGDFGEAGFVADGGGDRFTRDDRCCRDGRCSRSRSSRGRSHSGDCADVGLVGRKRSCHHRLRLYWRWLGQHVALGQGAQQVQQCGVIA